MILGKDSKETLDPVDALAARVLLDSKITVDAAIKGHPFASEILKCLQNKTAFGLSNGETSWIIFNVEKNHIYDYSYHNFTICNAGDYRRLLVYLRMAVITHREFRTSEMCVRFLQDKNLLT